MISACDLEIFVTLSYCHIGLRFRQKGYRCTYVIPLRHEANAIKLLSTAPFLIFFIRRQAILHKLPRRYSRSATPLELIAILVIGNESVPKITINDTINLFVSNCNQHFANFKP